MEKNFLETWKEVIYKLRDKGLITQEEIEQGIDLPIEWLYTSGIQRDTIILALRNLYEKQHPNNKYQFNRFKQQARLSYCEKDGKPAIEVSAGKCSIFITDEKMKSEGWNKNVTTKELISRIISAKKRRKMFEFMDRCNMSKQEATTAVGIFYDEQQQQTDLYGMPYNLNEMAINFGEYYTYIEEEKKISKLEEGPIEISGGIIEPVTDTTGERAPVENSSRPRVSEIYTFEQRDKIFRDLKPERIIKFNGVDKSSGEIIRGFLTCYIYEKPQGNDGYIVVAEPLEGNKETQAFYRSTEMIESLRGEEKDSNKFWKDLSTEYVERMSRSEFAKEENTHTFKHNGDLETYKQKIEGVIKGTDHKSQRLTIRRASRKLFGKEELKGAIKGVTRSSVYQAAEQIAGMETQHTKEGEDVTNE